MLEDLTPPRKVWSCKVKTVIDGLDSTDKKILSEAVMNPDWKMQALERALAEKGILLGSNSIRSHRQKTCSCFRL